MVSELEVMLGLASRPEPQPELEAEPEVKGPARDEAGRFLPTPESRRHGRKNPIPIRLEVSTCQRCHKAWEWFSYTSIQPRTYGVCAECAAAEHNRRARERAAIMRSAVRGRLDH